MASWKDFILNLKRKLEKGVGADKTLHILNKLQKVPITLELLQETGIGKVVSSLKKQDGVIGDRAKALVGNWKKVAVEQGSTKNSTPNKSTHHSKSSKYTSQKEVHHSKTNSKNHHASSYENNYAYESDGEGERGYDPAHSGRDYANGSSLKYEPEFDQANEESDKFSEAGHSPDSYDPHSYDPHSSRDDYKSYVSSFSVEKTPESYTYIPSPTKKRENKNRASDEHERSERKHRESPARKEKYSLDESQSSQKHLSSKSSHSSENRNSSSKKKDAKPSASEGFNNSLCSFEDCLGFNDSVKTKKKKPAQVLAAPTPAPVQISTKSESKVKVKHGKEKHSSKGESCHSRKKSSKTKRKDYSEKMEVPSALKKKVKLEPLEEVDVLSTLPEIQPYYKPMRHKMPDSPPQKKKSMSNEEAIIYTSSRKEKTAVYAGRRNIHLTEVPTLQDASLRFLAENIDRYTYLDGAPYFLLKTVLERCQPAQLYTLEDYNPYLLEDTDELWHIHCLRDFKGKTPEEVETWRELYLRLHDEREAKLRNVTANISASMAKATPVRQTKLAYVDSVAKPPREVARKQAKHGTGLPAATPMKVVPLGKATPRPTAPHINASNSSSTNSIPVQPKKN